MIANVFIIFAAVTSTIALECNPESCGGKEQTLCKYPSPDPASICGEVNSASLTQEEKDEIVKAHNDKRALVASGGEKRGNPGPQPAGDIPPLEWNEEIAQVAQRWANQCNFGHDDCRNLDQSIGQNVAIVWDPSGYNSKLSDLVESWYNEVKDFDGSKVGKFEWQSEPQIGHYTQLVWGATTQVGCGVTKYLTDGSYHTYLVCDYGPTGNFIDRFQVGQNVASNAQSSGYKIKMAELVQSWYDEVSKFDSHNVKSFEFKLSTGHYTQLVWSETTLVGCGAVKYLKDKWYTTYLVCNYGPSRNWIGQPVYQTL